METLGNVAILVLVLAVCHRAAVWLKDGDARYQRYLAITKERREREAVDRDFRQWENRTRRQTIDAMIIAHRRGRA